MVDRTRYPNIPNTLEWWIWAGVGIALSALAWTAAWLVARAVSFDDPVLMGEATLALVAAGPLVVFGLPFVMLVLMRDWEAGPASGRAPDCVTPWSSHSFDLDENLKSEIRVHIREAAAWCSTIVRSGDPGAWLRSPELQPADLDYEVPPWLEIPAIRARTELLCHRRAAALRDRDVRMPSLAVALRSGRLLGHDLATCTADHESHACSAFFDVRGTPGWDSWVHCVTHDQPARDGTDAMQLFWIPNWFVAEASRAMVNSADCLVWIHPRRLGFDFASAAAALAGRAIVVRVAEPRRDHRDCV